MVYNYTKPRGPIAAMYSSPGPCYALPGLVGQPRHDPRSVHYKGPAYPFGIRHGKFKDECSPGPTYYPSPKIYRDGQDGTPHYSLYSRPRDSTLFKTPGPGAYSPERAGPTAKSSPPAYSFGTRHRGRKTDNVPGKYIHLIHVEVAVNQYFQQGNQPPFFCRSCIDEGLLRIIELMYQCTCIFIHM